MNTIPVNNISKLKDPVLEKAIYKAIGFYSEYCSGVHTPEIFNTAEGGLQLFIHTKDDECYPSGGWTASFNLNGFHNAQVHDPWDYEHTTFFMNIHNFKGTFRDLFKNNAKNYHSIWDEE